ncbi:eukaryotic aspartyl protease [Purpureocillium lavendulum]|uniref:Eukaryotic aspartyl protease n=1 Tax=Purpureocillium lavendulum TaxID=1247861 RepID=A0AB34FWR3_9HYPO|nr:eukaryotic aspartyl protease [Purpureocillium lavendulum]
MIIQPLFIQSNLIGALLQPSGMAPGCMTDLLIIFIVAASIVLADPSPKAAIWHGAPIGPDGPWNAVEVKIGSPGSTVALFPGRKFQSYVITSDYCAFNASISHCGAGTYSKDDAIQSNLAGIMYKPDAQSFLAGALVKGNRTSMFVDTVDLGCDDCVVVNSTLSLLESQMIAYPGGSWYPIFAGCLSLGAEAVNQTYTLGDAPAINASVIPWYLLQHDSTPSSSFGLHIGSAASSASMSGSLLYGGYDRNRVVGDVLGIDGAFTDTILLKDIGIRVIKGTSPFGFTLKESLLAAGNISLSSGLQVRLDACSPYLTLPKSTCDEIAANLPLLYNSSLGLYLWNTTNPQYQQIVRSASALSFTFSHGNKELTINVPFQHLNLTLVSPLADEPTPYFPCSTGGTGSYVLGRAFFQDAFMGANWETKRWWLAQASGPKLQSESNIVSVLRSDIGIYSGSGDWASSWDGIWTDLKLQGTNNTGPNSAEPNNSTTESQEHGLSTGARVGVGVGSALGALVLAAMAFLVWRWRSQKRKQEVAVHDRDTFHESLPDPGAKETTVLGFQFSEPAEVVGTMVSGHIWDQSELAGDERYPTSRGQRNLPYDGEVQELP